MVYDVLIDLVFVLTKSVAYSSQLVSSWLSVYLLLLSVFNILLYRTDRFHEEFLVNILVIPSSETSENHRRGFLAVVVQ